jgi:hypothetical protein
VNRTKHPFAPPVVLTTNPRWLEYKRSFANSAGEVVATDKVQIDSEARVLEIRRSSSVEESSPPPRRLPIRERLRTLLSPLRKFVSSLVAESLWVRILYTVLAALAGAVWALSLAPTFLSTGWPAPLHLVYAMVSAGFAVICALAALDLSSPDQLGRYVDARIRRKGETSSLQ